MNNNLTPRTKQANTPEEYKQLALRDIAHMGLAGLGVGLGARGLYGLYNMLARKNRGPEDPRSVGTIETEFPVGREDEDKEKAAQADPLTKQAFLSDILEYFGDVGAGEKTRSKTGIPWYLVGSAAAGAGGLYGGYKLMDMVLDKRRADAQEEELRRAQEEFRDALLSRHGKRASADNTLGEDLDLLFDRLNTKCAQLEKVAQEEGTATGDALGKLMGMYGLYAGGTGLLSGILMYNAAKKRQRRELLEKAKKERERRTFERMPPRIEAFPVA